MTIRIALIGLPGSGKTAVGRALADKLGSAHIDSDVLIEHDTGKTIPELFATEGETRFRIREHAAIRSSVTEVTELVLSCGGGAFVDRGLRQFLLQRCIVVWLDATDGEILQRLGSTPNRPLLEGNAQERLTELRKARQNAYSAAHLRVDTTSKSVDELATLLQSILSRTVVAEVPPRAYPIVVGNGVRDQLHHFLALDCRSVAIVCDANLSAVANELASSLQVAQVKAKVIPIEGGETAKRWEGAGALLEELATAGIDRSGCIIAVGGGTIGDLAGFAAATYLRGIPWIVVPSTLLAMVDSAIGGKTGVDLSSGKNLAGAIWQPSAVLCDPELLATCPPRAHKSAMAEVIKYSMISTGPLAELLENHFDAILAADTTQVTAVVRECVRIKAAVIARDPLEKGERAILNYGHTVGHAIEAATGYGDAVWHGEAIATGMRVAGALSAKLLGCPPDEIVLQNYLLDRCELPPQQVRPEDVIPFLARDKKAVAGKPRWVMLSSRGHPRYGGEVSDVDVEAALREILRA